MNFLTRNVYVLWVVYLFAAWGRSIHINMPDAPVILRVALEVVLCFLLGAFTTYIFTIFAAIYQYILRLLKATDASLGSASVAILSFAAGITLPLVLVIVGYLIFSPSYQTNWVFDRLGGLVAMAFVLSVATTINYKLFYHKS